VRTPQDSTGSDAFVARYSAPDGSLPVAERSSDQGLAVLGDASGDAFWMAGTVDLFEADLGTGPLPEVATGPDLFVARGTARSERGQTRLGSVIVNVVPAPGSLRTVSSPS
jgi:hypothetical protein